LEFEGRVKWDLRLGFFKNLRARGPSRPKLGYARNLKYGMEVTASLLRGS